MERRWGILLMAYGGPNSLDEVEPYYTHILRGRKPSAEMLHELMERYRAIGGKSPINDITFAQAQLLQERLNTRPPSLVPRPVSVYVGMKHWHPYIAEAIERMASDGVTEAVGIILAPHYSRRSVAEYIGYATEALERLGNPIRFRFVESWATHPLLVRCFAEKVRKAWAQFDEAERDKVQLLFTAHSLPQRILEWNDPYPDELRRTCEAVAQTVGVSDWLFAYQSASGTDWLGPDILEVLDELAGQGHRYVLVAPIGFLCDHLEVLYDIDIEATEKAQKLGIKLRRIEMPNTDPLLIGALADIAQKAMSGVEDGFRLARKAA
ncbi:MAG: ferrochelatase [Armatimonadota bacterium]|jgi:ferrochelatase|nr:ferrochelatase [Armatimonadota bacterium]MDT7971526.1 ferrochelatase [Armatimonadota bacterium]